MSRYSWLQTCFGKCQFVWYAQIVKDTAGLTITHIVDGQVISETSEWNVAGMLKQLGVIPSSTPAS